MAIAKMKRVQLLALESQREALMEALLRLGCLEVGPSQVPEEASRLLRPSQTDLTQLQGALRQLQEALDTLKRAAPQKSGLLSPRPAVREETFLAPGALEQGLETARQVSAHSAAIARLKARLERLETERLSLEPWQAWPLPLEQSATRCTLLQLGTLPLRTEMDTARGILADRVPEAELFSLGQTPEQRCVALLSHRDVTEQALEALRPLGYTAAVIKAEGGTVAENLRRISGDATQAAQELEQEQQALRSLGPQQQELALCLDRAQLQLRRLEARQNSLSDGCVLYLSGWVPEKQEARLVRLLERYDCAYQLREPTDEEIPDVPVQLENGRISRCMSCITEQYSLPAYDGVDPNPLMAPFFILFFGMMMADMAYGLLMIAGSLLILRRKRPANPNFMEMILWCGITTFVFGALTGGFLGDFIPQLCRLIDPGSTFDLPALFSPLNDTMAVMVGSLILGGIQILTGMTISVVKKCRDGCFADALWDEITWWVILAGGGLAILGLGSVAGVPVLLVIGVLMLIYGSGRGKKGFGKVTGLVSAVYNGVTGFFSDILSYVRLMALMLSGAVLAQVFNMLGATTGSVVGFVLIAPVGNALNLALNLLGCYVHDMRLQFLEFFGRFYKEGGRAYRPLSVQANYAEIIKEEQDNV